MKKSIKTAALTALAAVLALSLTGCSTSSDSGGANTPSSENASPTGQAPSTTGAEDKTSYTVGIGQFAAHGSLDNCREGFLLGLAEEGIVEGENLTILYENAQADGAIASQIVTNFASQNVDLICAVATPMAQSAYSVGKKKDIPVIYTAVTDPVAAELAGNDGTPAGEITGTSDKLPVTKQLQMIRAILPHHQRG